MSRLRALSILLLLSGLTACAGTPAEPPRFVPVDTAPDCQPPADLMVKPTVPLVKAGVLPGEQIARDGTALTVMARDFYALQTWVLVHCTRAAPSALNEAPGWLSPALG